MLQFMQVTNETKNRQLKTQATNFIREINKGFTLLGGAPLELETLAAAPVQKPLCENFNLYPFSTSFLLIKL